PFYLSTHPAPTEIYTLSLHDALPIFDRRGDLADREAPLEGAGVDDRARADLAGRERPLEAPDGVPDDDAVAVAAEDDDRWGDGGDRKSTRLNSSHLVISYAVFCLKKK